MRLACFYITSVLFSASSLAAAKPHSILFGPWRSVELHKDASEKQRIKVRDLIIDGKLREHTSGPMHEITDRIFVVRRAILLNDALPQDAKNPQWIWRLTVWISVDRQTGRISSLNLPSFDGDISEASWYRDYAAYCSSSDDGSKSYMVVSQAGLRKPILKKEYPGSACTAPKWERTPSRVTFVAGNEKASFVIHAHSADPQPDAEEEGPQQ
jgi:hypothetical protein